MGRTGEYIGAVVKNIKKYPRTSLIVIFLLSVMFRFILVTAFSGSPSIFPDEPLYLNLAGSFARGDGIMLRGQTLNYTAVFYSLLISLCYRLPVSVDVYRAVQLLNCTVMSLAVFPAYVIAKQLERTDPLGCACLVLLLPDFVIVKHAMTEPLLFPLVLCLIVLFLCQSEKDSIIYAVPTAILCFLIYITKQGAVAYVIAYAVTCILKRTKTDVMRSGLFLIVFIGLYMIWEPLLTWLFHADFTSQSIYQTQTAGFTMHHLLATLNGSFLYTFYMILGFGIIPPMILLFHWKRLEAKEKVLYQFVMLSVAVLTLGTVYMFYYDELYLTTEPANLRIHLRYLFPMYYPLFLCFVSPKLYGAGLKRGQFYLGTAVVCLLAVLGFSKIISGDSYPVDAMLLNHAFVKNPVIALPEIMVLVFTIIVIWTVTVLYSGGWDKQQSKTAVIALVLLLIAANGASYYADRHNRAAGLRYDANQAVSIAGGNTLFINEGSEDFDKYLDAVTVRMRGRPYYIKLFNYCKVQDCEFALNTIAVPGYWTTNGDQRIRDVEYVIIERSLLNHAVIPVEEEPVHTANGYFSIYRLKDINQFPIHSTLSGYKDKVWSQDIGLWVFDQDLMSRPTIKVHLKLKSPVGQMVYLECADERQAVWAEAGEGWTVTEFQVPDSFSLKVKIDIPQNVVIETYALE